MKDSRLNQFKDNDQSFVHQSPAGTVQMKPSRLPENGNLTTVSYNLSESGETGMRPFKMLTKLHQNLFKTFIQVTSQQMWHLLHQQK